MNNNGMSSRKMMQLNEKKERETPSAILNITDILLEVTKMKALKNVAPNCQLLRIADQK